MPHPVASGFFPAPLRRIVTPWVAVGVALLGCDAAPSRHQVVVPSLATISPSPPGAAADRSDPGAPASLAARADRSLRLSRALLLGSRDPTAESCVRPMLTGSVTTQVPPDMGDIDGGPGTRLATLLFVSRDDVTTAVADLRWHQTRLRRFLDNERSINGPVLEAAEAFHAAAAMLAARAVADGELPWSDFETGWRDDTTWPGWCLCRLDEAVRARDVKGVQRWSAELEGATFWLVDLHRWLHFLTANFSAALDFQRESPEAFRRIDRGGGTYEILSAPSCLPAGMLTQHGRSSFLEVERQAERIFTMPMDRVAEIRGDANLTPESILVPPARRAAFLAYADALSAANRRTLVRAARTPYECSFLVNMLYRADSGEFVERQCEVLRRFDRLVPEATVAELMGVLFYRGHSFSALEWADRFHPELLDEAARIEGGPEEAFAAACRRAHDAFTATGRYGLTLTLRDSLAKGTYDCVRATDLALTLFRNSGRSGVGHVRWSAGVEGHSVAAFWGCGTGQVLVDDPLTSADEPRAWPDAYFQGATWPELLRDNAKPYTAELYVRGLDNYVWAAGYVIRGERAGLLVTAEVPYLANFPAAGERTVFAGPFPDH